MKLRIVCTLLIFAMFSSSGLAQTGSTAPISKQKFGGTYKSAVRLQTAISAGLTRARLGALLEDLQNELSLLKDRGLTKAETTLASLYSEVAEWLSPDKEDLEHRMGAVDLCVLQPARKAYVSGRAPINEDKTIEAAVYCLITAK